MCELFYCHWGVKDKTIDVFVIFLVRVVSLHPGWFTVRIGNWLHCILWLLVLSEGAGLLWSKSNCTPDCSMSSYCVCACAWTGGLAPPPAPLPFHCWASFLISTTLCCVMNLAPLVVLLSGVDGPWMEWRCGARCATPVQTGPGGHPASDAMGSGSFPGVNQAVRGVNHPPPPSAGVEE